MSRSGTLRVASLLGVGFDREEETVRITQAGQYRVLMGSDKTHQALQDICRTIDEAVKASGRPITDYSPDELMELIQELY